MIVHRDFSTFSDVPNPVVTIGTFDGVHSGHRQLLSRLNELASAVGGQSTVLTFYPHPRMVLHPTDHQIQLLSTPEEKAALLEEAGVHHLVVYPFSKEFSRLSAYDYVRDLLVSGLHAHTVVIGYDHRFGRNREGDHQTLLELSEVFGFGIEEIPAQTIDAINISSTKIRSALLAGAVKDAAKYLGRHYSLRGTVVHGDKVGRQLGYPTANIDCGYNYKLIPASGVYAVKVSLEGEKMYGVMNIGVRPTTHNNSAVVTEVFILNFDRDIYGKQLTIEFVERLRHEEKFGSIDALKLAIANDIEKAKTFF